MEQFVVSARKYRPIDFEDVVGQQAITQTLLNAIRSNHLAQALLFTGPRGVGKTTCARILAKKINTTENTQVDEDFAFNIFELDAASNNSVDDIRSLTDQVRIPPQSGKYKVYIIDEVHMLSQSAFNAFLKTLEEPPKHAIFILATTEKHKILPTILSRCQIFDFKRITIQDIKEHLAHIAKIEGIETEEEALHIIAQKADGALRDALSTFDRVVTFCGKKLTRKAVAENLNVLDYDAYFQATESILTGNVPKLLNLYNEILSKGFEGLHFVSGLAAHFRDLMVSKNKDTQSLIETGEQVREQYIRQSNQCTGSFLIYALDLANQCSIDYKNSSHQRLLVELLLLKLASAHQQAEEKKNPEPELIHTEPKPIKPQQNLEYKDLNKLDSNEIEESTTPLEPTKLPDIPKKERISALSIKSLQVQKNLAAKTTATQIDTSIKPQDTFTEEMLQTCWKEFADAKQSKGEHIIASILNCNKPLANDNVISFEFPNISMKNDFANCKSDLQNFLTEKLNNHFLQFKLTVSESIEQKIAYTTEDKLERLIEKNENLKLLINTLKLDI
ncbi:MAG: DNA polymerase III subunit gamma/tau [Flavobacteriaceae bacterium]|nr:DNA polymerase III subunit gamma/tau [Flavobacteriaceae bacterium]MDZ4148904.1 DNA polymerase III subunit gamma/tau [Flavobacteriaceae bacterium]